jgi:hypothetical protein
MNLLNSFSSFSRVNANRPREEIYYGNVINNNYYNVNNWFRDPSFVFKTNFIPHSNSIVKISGNSAITVDIDNPAWVTPYSIDTLNVSDPSGIILYSNVGKHFNGTIIGNSTLSGVILD